MQKKSLLMALALLLSPLAAGALPATNDAPPSAGGGQSVIIKLGEDSRRARSVIISELTPRMLAVRDELRAAAAAVAEAQGRAEKEGTLETQQNLDRVFADAVAGVLGKMEGVLAQRESVAGANGRLLETTRKAQKEFEQRRADYKTKVADFQRQAEQIRGELDKTYQIFRPALERGEALPEEVAWKVQLADFQRQSLEERQKIYAKAQGDLEKALAKLGDYAKLVATLRGQYELLFGRCQGQMGLLTDWMGLRRDAAEFRGISAQIAETAQALGQINTVSGEIDRTIQGVDWGGAGEVREHPELTPAKLSANSSQAAARAILELAHRSLEKH